MPKLESPPRAQLTLQAPTQLGEPQAVLDKRGFKHILQSMNSTLRDSQGGGILERFDVIGKLLFLKAVDEREVKEGTKPGPDFCVLVGDEPESVAQRLRSMWERACRNLPHLHPSGVPGLSDDAPALYRIAELLQSVSVSGTRGDVKGLAYEELLRNTFDKSENQQYFTPHELVEFMVGLARPTRESTVCDPACGTGGFLVEVCTRTGAARAIGAEVDERLARVAQMNLVMHGADWAVVHRLPASGSLAPLDAIKHALPASSFDLILTNPPFGSDLFDSRSLAMLETGRDRASRRRSVLFTERCLELIRPGGRLIIVLDDSVLNLPSNVDVRRLIRARAVIEAVVSLPDVAFMPYSSAKCSIVVLRRKVGPEEQGPVFMADVADVGRRPNGDPLYAEERDAEGRRVPLSDLPGIADEFERFRRTGGVCHPKCFVTHLSDDADRLDIFHYHPKRFEAEQELAECRWPTPMLRELATVRRQRVNPASELGDTPIVWMGLAEIEERTGQFEASTVLADRIKSQANVFTRGDILFSRLRPNLRKVVLIPDTHDGGFCSAEMLVLRGLDRADPQEPGSQGGTPAVASEYLAFILRSDLVYGQLMNQITGLGRPRVSQAAILSLRIPLPPLEEQRRIVSVLQSARDRSTAARERASMWMKRSDEILEGAYNGILSDLSAKAVRRP